MKYLRTTSTLLLFSCWLATSSVNANPNACYVELGGPSILYSINYERLFLDRIAARIGYSYVGGQPTLTTVPFSVSYLLGSKNHRLESGIGCMYATFSNFSADQSFWLAGGEPILDGFGGNVYIGYRYQPITRGLVFRAGVAPSFSWRLDYFLPWFGLSLGYSF